MSRRLPAEDAAPRNELSTPGTYPPAYLRLVVAGERSPAQRIEQDLVTAAQLQHIDEVLQVPAGALEVFSPLPNDSRGAKGQFSPRGQRPALATQRLHSQEQLLDVRRKWVLAVDDEICQRVVAVLAVRGCSFVAAP